MAKILGESGRYVSEESVKRFGKTITSIYVLKLDNSYSSCGIKESYHSLRRDIIN